VDPDNPLPSTAHYKNSMGIAEAKRRRQEHRDQMSIPDFTRGIAEIRWGNCGTLEYINHANRLTVNLQSDEELSIHSESSG
jgi:hypothetical protein